MIIPDMNEEQQNDINEVKSFIERNLTSDTVKSAMQDFYSGDKEETLWHLDVSVGQILKQKRLMLALRSHLLELIPFEELQEKMNLMKDSDPDDELSEDGDFFYDEDEVSDEDDILASGKPFSMRDTFSMNFLFKIKSLERDELPEPIKYPVVRWELIYDLLCDHMTENHEYVPVSMYLRDHMEQMQMLQPMRLLRMVLNDTLVKYMLVKDENISDYDATLTKQFTECNPDASEATIASQVREFVFHDEVNINTYDEYEDDDQAALIYSCQIWQAMGINPENEIKRQQGWGENSPRPLPLSMDEKDDLRYRFERACEEIYDREYDVLDDMKSPDERQEYFKQIEEEYQYLRDKPEFKLLSLKDKEDSIATDLAFLKADTEGTSYSDIEIVKRSIGY
ncbi:MAG: hypothetical protein J5934_07605 [Succinivibrio sp.]|nr:hypothetical protein [Succinivibrio sp.]